MKINAWLNHLSSTPRILSLYSFSSLVDPMDDGLVEGNVVWCEIFHRYMDAEIHHYRK